MLSTKQQTRQSIAILRKHITPQMFEFIINLTIDLEDQIREHYYTDPASLEQFDQLCLVLDGNC
jgi:menaquinone-dependent protoporphyrinogen IX oxidase